MVPGSLVIISVHMLCQALCLGDHIRAHIQSVTDMEPRDESDGRAHFLAVVAEVFGVDELTETDHFFDLGGDSLDAVIVMDRINTDYGVSPTLDLFFQSDSLADLADRWWTMVAEDRAARSQAPR